METNNGNSARKSSPSLVALESVANRNVYNNNDDADDDILTDKAQLELNKTSHAFAPSVTSSTITSSSFSTSVSSSPSINFHCPEQFGYFADSNDCSRYFVCVFGDPLHETCTGGLYFSTELQTCNWKDNVICNNNDNNNNSPLDDDFKNEDSIVLQVAPSGKNSKLPSSNNNNPRLSHIGVKSSYVVEGNNNNKVKDIENDRKTKDSSEYSVPDQYGTNDLDQTQFDESIASFIDQNGDVYVHDGPGGLYSLIEGTSTIADHDRPLIYQSSSSSSSSVSLTDRNSNSIHSKVISKNPHHHNSFIFYNIFFIYFLNLIK